MRRSLVALALATAVGGCSIVTDLSALAPPTEGGAPGEDTGTPAVDDTGAPPGDSATDADADADGSSDAEKPRAYCAQLSYDWGYDYCRDFDDSEPILFEWDLTDIDSGGSITRDPATTYSAPGAFLAKLAAGASACSAARAERKVDKPLPAKIRVHFRVRLGSASAPDTDYAGAYMGLRLGDLAGSCDLVFWSTPMSGGVTEEPGPGSIDHSFALRWPAQRTWVLVEALIDRAALTLQVNIDGKPVYSTPRTLSAACGGTGPVVVAPGILCHDATTSPAEVRIDNLVVTR